jgi:hypothetical protein
MKYLCTFTNRQTGERSEIVVSLEDIDREDRAFLDRNRVMRPGAGSPGGPIERACAYALARKQVPSDLAYNIEDPDCCRWVN